MANSSLIERMIIMSSTDNITDIQYVTELMKRAHAAQKIAESFAQEYVDKLTREIGWALVQPDTVDEIARFCLQETRMGTLEAKQNKLFNKVRGVLNDINPLKSVGVVEENKELGIRRLGKPVGVIGSLIPTTQPELCPATQAILAVKARDAIIFSPHPRSQGTTYMVTEVIRNVLDKNGAPKDLCICMEHPTMEKSQELMRQANLVIATGGAGMVKSAYSSGTPAYGVGVGNAVVVVDESADLKQAARNVHVSKVFDYASGCSCDNSVVVQESVYDEFIKCLEAEGAYLTNKSDYDKMRKALWPEWPKNHQLNRDIVTQPAQRIAEIAGIEGVGDDCEMILVEENGYGFDHPFSGEKLCVVLTVFKYKEFQEAIDIVNGIHDYMGAGHSCGIQTTNDEHAMELALHTHTTRVMINQAQSGANGGSWTNGMPFTGSLGCGTWGGNVISENITLKHFLNNTWVATTIPSRQPSDEEIFKDAMK